MLARANQPIYASGECEVDLQRCELRLLGTPAPLGGRAFEILQILVRSAGKIVSKDELMERIWPGAIVLENTLQVHIAAVRRALGPHRALLKTESGRGYRLLGEWTPRDQPSVRWPGIDVPPIAEPGKAATNLPGLVTPLIGRSDACEVLRDLISAYRVVTLTGPGGIGKTTLALQIARDLCPDFADGGWLVELASLSDPDLVPTAVAGALQLSLGGGEISTAALARAISDKNLLLLLDNCEHVIDATAHLAETLARSCPRVTILSTSREVLRIDGEYVYRVSSLDVPKQDEFTNLVDHSAVKLFIAKMESLDSDFLPDTDKLRLIAAICRHLDGIPLAIEFAAARAATLGVDHVAAGLENRFVLLTSGRRTALPRHRTLRATLDWSYELLSTSEQQLLCHLAVFPAGFTLDAAIVVAQGVAMSPAAVADGIINLANKSLVTAEQSEPSGRWRLLETTRAYALDKLAESSDMAEVARRHAEFYLALFSSFSVEDRLPAAIDELDRYRREIDNLRAALNWAFSAAGDIGLRVELAAAATDFWSAVSLLAEGGEWTAKALTNLGASAGTRYEMVLRCSLGMTLIYTKGMIAAAREMLSRALALARELADFSYQQRAFHGLWLFSARSMAIKEALAYARQYEGVARGRDPHSQATADWLIGHTQLYLAEYREAVVRLRRAIDRYPIENRDRDMIRFVNDLRASAFGHLSVGLFSLGLLDAASRVAANAVEEARATNQPIVLCIALAWESALFLKLGDLETAARYGEELIDHAYKHTLRPFHAAGLCVRGSLAAKRGDPESGIDPLRSGLVGMQQANYLLFYPLFRAELAAALGAIGRVDESLAEIDGAMRFAEENDYRWFLPEILRMKGELLVLRGADDLATISDLFLQSVHQAHGQQALYWELCAATSLAELLHRQHRATEARAALASTYGRFMEGFAAPQMKRAKALLDQLDGP